MKSCPSPPSAEIAPLIGQYGRSDAMLDVSEDHGSLCADGFGLADARIDRVEADFYVDAVSGQPLVFAPDGAAVVVGTEKLLRRDFGAEAVASFQRALPDRPQAPSSEEAPRPALEAATLVSIASAIPSITLDIRYAGSDNFMGRPIYDRACAYARPAVVAALAQVQADLERRSYGLVVHDAYRPWSVTKLFWDAVPPEHRAFVADPATGSKHNRGCAIDLTLRDLATGVPVAMPSRYDEPTARARCDYRGSTGQQRWHRDLLRGAMERHGFTVQQDEWWHFDFHAWRDYPVEDTPLAALDTSTKGYR